jgi:hypothetical protein
MRDDFFFHKICEAWIKHVFYRMPMLSKPSGAKLPSVARYRHVFFVVQPFLRAKLFPVPFKQYGLGNHFVLQGINFLLR